MSNSNEPQHFSQDDDDEILDEIEAEMAEEEDRDEEDMLSAAMSNTIVSSSAATSHAASYATLPSHQVNHAAEFWFPECRDCACCKGYKHGCSCGGVCKCSQKSEGCVSSLSDATNNAFVHTGSNQQTLPVKAACKFYQSGNCRFGQSCRFSHD
jgi:hypothetical protein